MQSRADRVEERERHPGPGRQPLRLGQLHPERRAVVVGARAERLDLERAHQPVLHRAHVAGGQLDGGPGHELLPMGREDPRVAFGEPGERGAAQPQRLGALAERQLHRREVRGQRGARRGQREQRRQLAIRLLVAMERRQRRTEVVPRRAHPGVAGAEGALQHGQRGAVLDSDLVEPPLVHPHRALAGERLGVQPVRLSERLVGGLDGPPGERLGLAEPADPVEGVDPLQVEAQPRGRSGCEPLRDLVTQRQREPGLLAATALTLTRRQLAPQTELEVVMRAAGIGDRLLQQAFVRAPLGAGGTREGRGQWAVVCGLRVHGARASHERQESAPLPRARRARPGLGLGRSEEAARIGRRQLGRALPGRRGVGRWAVL
ncbi:MAG: hypothetical protein ACYC8T_02235 [Myxococcaceae bacterium]